MCPFKRKSPIVLLVFGLILGILTVYEFSRLSLSVMEIRLFAVIQLMVLSYACFAASAISAACERIQKLEKAHHDANGR